MTPGRARSALVPIAAGLLLPGAGHLLAGRPVAGAALLTAFAAGAAAALVHLARGLGPFETTAGVFLFAWLLRSLLALHGWALVDLVIRLALPRDRLGPRRRAAALASLVVPGAGQLLARSWLGAAGGMAVTAVIVLTARHRQLPMLDLLLILLQAATAVAAHQRLLARQGATPDRIPLATRARGVPHFQAAQVVVLLALMGATATAGALELHRMPAYPFAAVGPKDVRVHPGPRGVRFEIPRLGLTMRAVGRGWVARAFTPGELCRAVDAGRAQVVLRGHPILTFMRRDRYVASLRRQMAHRGSRFVSTKALRINGLPATQLAFRRRVGEAEVMEWLVVVPRGAYAYLLRLEWDAARDRLLRPRMQATRDSLRIAPGSP